jgi:uncharacterized protein YndB with AHSA1/START domain
MKNNPVPSPSPADRRLVISRVFNAPCPMVFKAWTEPAQMAQWWSPKDIQCREVQAEGRVGGAYRIHMISEKGDHIAFGKYTEFVPNKRIQFTWQWENYAMPDSTVTVEFEDLGKTTRLTLTHAGLPDEEDVTEHNRGWSSLIEKFADMIEGNQIKF